MLGGGYLNGTSGVTTGRDCFLNRDIYWKMDSSVTLGAIHVGHHEKFITLRHAIGSPTPAQRENHRNSSNTVGGGCRIGAGGRYLRA